jgi:hypothetical protein
MRRIHRPRCPVAQPVSRETTIYLVMRRLEAEARPGVLYGAYLGLPPKPTRDRAYRKVSCSVSITRAVSLMTRSSPYRDTQENPR